MLGKVSLPATEGHLSSLSRQRQIKNPFPNNEFRPNHTRMGYILKYSNRPRSVAFYFITVPLHDKLKIANVIGK